MDSNEFMLKTKKGKAIRQKIEKLQNEKQQQAQTKQEEIKKLQTELLSPALNDDTRVKKSEELNKKQVALKRFLEDSRSELERAFQKEVIAMDKQIMPLLQEMGKTKGFTLILETQKSGVLYFDQAVDITDEVIKAFDARYSK